MSSLQTCMTSGRSNVNQSLLTPSVKLVSGLWKKLVVSLHSLVLSQESIAQGYLGQKLTETLSHIHRKPIRTRSNYARHNTEMIAIAACAGLITTNFGGYYTREWRLTLKGMAYLEKTNGRT